MKPRIFMVSIDEIAANFAFGERFRGEYTRQVTLSDGSTRTVRLTPAIYKDMELVQLNDTGHVSYMGPHGTTTNGRLMVQVRAFDLLYPDGKSCAAGILSVPAVQDLYRSLGTDPEIIRARVAKVAECEDEPELDTILMGDSGKPLGYTSRLPQELRLLCGLAMHARAELQEALTPCDGRAGDIPFFIARQQRESDLQSLWPAPAHQTGRILLLDDPFTSMNTVARVLHEAFGLDVAAASQKSHEVHASGQCVLELGPPGDAAATCRRLNASWRAAGLPLYCAPQAEKTND